MTAPNQTDPVWEEKYAQGHASRYPWDSVVSFVYRYAPKDRPRHQVNILELGCGTAANLWFAAREGFSVAGVDGAPSAIATAQARFKEDGLEADLRIADFSSLPFADQSFDMVIDRAALTCVPQSVAQQSITEAYRVLKPAGYLFFNPYSDRHTSFTGGSPGDDGRIYDIQQGTLQGAGALCFYSRQQVVALLAQYNILSLQHIEAAEMAAPHWSVHAEWRIVAQRL